MTITAVPAPEPAAAHAAVVAARPRLPGADRARVRNRRAAGRRTGTGAVAQEPRLAPGPAAAPELPEAARAAITARRRRARAENTRTTYAYAVRRFTGWCKSLGVPALPAHPETIAAYLATADEVRREDGSHAYAQSTLLVWAAGIADAHARAGYANPIRDLAVAETLSGIAALRTEEGDAPDQAAPLRLDHLRRLVGTLNADADAIADEEYRWAAQVAARRDTALLVLGYAGAFRRAELGKLWIGDITPLGDADSDWLQVRLRGSKTSPTAAATVVLARGTTAPHTCPWCVYLRWVTVVAAYDRAAAAATRRGRPAKAVRAAGEVAVRTVLAEPGPQVHVCREPWPVPDSPRAPLFRSLKHRVPIRPPDGRVGLTGDSIGRMIKARARQAGYSEAEIRKWRGHSPRAGSVSDMLGHASHGEVGRHSRQTPRTVARYDRRAQTEANPIAAVGL